VGHALTDRVMRPVVTILGRVAFIVTRRLLVTYPKVSELIDGSSGVIPRLARLDIDSSPSLPDCSIVDTGGGFTLIVKA
jgi:hypothetical protein